MARPTKANQQSRRDRTALAAALLVVLPLAACSDLFPWHKPVVRAFISAGLPQCPDSLSPCATLTTLPRDSQLLARLDGQTPPDSEWLVQTTGIQWTEAERQHDGLHLKLPVPPKGERQSVYVLETLRSETAHDSLLSIASNGGIVIWLNGSLLAASRSADRPARVHQNLYTAPLKQGVNLLLYRVLTNNPEAQFHREWLPRTALPDLLASAMDLGVYSTLASRPIMADSAISVPLLAPELRISDGPILHFRWLSMAGDSLADGGRFPGPYPGELPLPSQFHGMAVLRTEVLDAAGTKRLYVEDAPVFADSTARRLSRELAASDPGDDPIGIARRDAVREVFRLESDSAGRSRDPWLGAQVLASLYRYVRQPDAFQRFLGPQVWGYRADDGTVQPFWLTVPPGAVELPNATSKDRPGLIFWVTHHVNPDFWAGRGRVTGFLIHMATLGSSYGTFGVMLHLRGLHDFDTVAVKELPAITKQVASVFAIDTSAVGMMAWSSHALESVQMSLDPKVSVAWLGLAGPAMHIEKRELNRVLDSLRSLRPRLHWLVWRGAEDSVVTSEATNPWLKMVRRKGFDVRYRIIPWSTHLTGFFEDVESDLHRSVANRFRGAAGKALRDSLEAEVSARRN